MNKKYFALLICALFSASLSFAARVTVYNETKNEVQVWVYFGSKNGTDTAIIQPSEEHTFNTIMHAFTTVEWKENDILFKADIPSSRTLLTGSIVLRGKGEIGVNFNAKGQVDPFKINGTIIHNVTLRK